jgi:hypothetical protein
MHLDITLYVYNPGRFHLSLYTEAGKLVGWTPHSKEKWPEIWKFQFFSDIFASIFMPNYLWVQEITVYDALVPSLHFKS